MQSDFEIEIYQQSNLSNFKDIYIINDYMYKRMGHKRIKYDESA